MITYRRFSSMTPPLFSSMTPPLLSSMTPPLFSSMTPRLFSSMTPPPVKSDSKSSSLNEFVIFLSINNPNIVFAAYHFVDDSSSWTGALESLSRSSSSWTAVLQEGEVPAAQVLDNFRAQNEHVEAELFSRIRNLENRLIDRLPPQLNRGEYATLVRENIDQSINLFHYQSSLSNEIFEITVIELKADLQDQLFNLLLSEPDHRLIQILSESPFPESAIRREALEFILLKMEAVNLNLDNARSRFDKVLLEQLLSMQERGLSNGYILYIIYTLQQKEIINDHLQKILVYDPTAILVYDPTAIIVYDPTAILVYDPTAILVNDTTAIFLSINNPNIVFAAYHFADDSSSWTGALESLSRSSSSWTAVLQEGEVPAAQVLDNFHAQNEHVDAELFSRIRNLENRLIDRLPPQLNRGEYATLVRENIDQSINLFHYQSSLSNEIFEITVLELKADLQDQLFNLLLSEPDHRLIQILSESPFPESAIRREALEFILLKMEAVNLNLDNARSRFDKVLLEQLLRLGLNFTFDPCFGLWFDDPSPWPISGYPPSEIACGQTISSIARRVSFPTQSLYQFQSPRLMFSPYGV
ncbi:hypothetical protein V6N11_010272 [Hibiscus sabdariffa]|uniref:Uncharacterized protein n=1 Tax=Hibiscus sabdariffa TaxID=183260 RepID=A0ABR2PE38_9ROSI